MSRSMFRALCAVVALATPSVLTAEPVFVNTIQIAGTATDLSGLPAAAGNNRLGGFASDLFYDAAHNVYYGIPDRGPGGGLIDFDTRVQVFTLDVDLGSGAISNFLLTDTIVFKDAAGQAFTGLNPGLNGNSAVLGRSFDPEGLVVGANGHFYVSDEYGPSVYEFAADGSFVRSFATPSNLIPVEPGGQTNFTDGRPIIVEGRQDNRGFEGLTLTPDGTRLLAVLQDPLVNEGAQNDGRRSGNVRIVAFDTTIGAAVAQYIYPLETVASINTRVPASASFNATAQGRNIGVSAIYPLSNDEFLVLERDNRGIGIDDATGSVPVASKRVYRIDIDGATDVSGISLANTNTLPAGVLPVTKTATPFLDIASALSAAGLALPEKIEGITVGPKLNDGSYLLLLGTDNDFSVTQTGAGAQLDVCFGGALPGTQVPIGTPCPAGSGLLPTFLYAFKAAPGDLATAVPEPGAWALLAAGVAGFFRRRKLLRHTAGKHQPAI